MQGPQAQLQAIQSMLASGHRCVHLERHSLLLFGGVGGFLSVTTTWVINDSLFPNVTHRGFALLLWLAFWLGSVSLMDHWLTRRVRAQREETLPFAQAQITRAWWMLLTMGSLGSFAMFFYGGAGMIYALWIVMLGLGVYLFGLFSRPLVEWIGLATILLGVSALAAGLPYEGTRWLTASSFAIGMPLAGWLNRRLGDTGMSRRIIALAFWLLMVVSPALLIIRLSHTEPPHEPPLPVAAVSDTGEQVVRVEAGTRLPLRISLDGPLLSIPRNAELDMILHAPVELALLDGRPDGRYRIGNGPWRDIRRSSLHLNIDSLGPRLEKGRAVVRSHATLITEDW